MPLLIKVPVGLPHGVRRKELKVGPYTVPNDHFLLANYEALHTANGAWGDDGDVFNPDRFLEPVRGSTLKNDLLMPFSVGKRICPGEGLARAELFLFIVGLLQSFKFEPELLGEKPPITRKMGLTSAVLPFKVKISKIQA